MSVFQLHQVLASPESAQLDMSAAYHSLSLTVLDRLMHMPKANSNAETGAEVVLMPNATTSAKAKTHQSSD